MAYEIRPLDDDHRPWANAFLAEAWGSHLIASRGRLLDSRDLPGVVVFAGRRPAGLATYRQEQGECELTTINSIIPGAGIGSMLIDAVRQAAEAAGCWRLWAITTNDNLEALRFYQRRDFRLVAVYPNAMAESRRLKPGISLTGKDNIPLRDEIELELLLAPPGPRIRRLHHAQVTISEGAEDEARAFYSGLLGMPEISQPDSLAGRGGFWLQAGDRQIHVGVEAGVERQGTKAYLAYEVYDLAGWRERLAAAGHPVSNAVPIAGYDRLEFRDPFGNRVELIETLAEGQPQDNGQS
jgi:catechol 2,3-dioxygenase-like lactoylglutathione lyase family enzyme/GNAT superfamily N-acetyltransferase